VTRSLVVCADDFAYSPAICDAIVDLAGRGRISAISCMTNMPLWHDQAQRLRPLIGRVDIGVHLTLIEEAPLTAMPRTVHAGRMPSLIAAIRGSYLGSLALDEFAGEVAAQCDAFVSALGIPPSHLDGHRHAHVLPGLRDLVLQAAAQYAPRPWIRNVAEPVGRVLVRGIDVPKSLIITALGAAMPRAARAAGISINGGFSGAYSLSPDEDFPGLFDRFLDGAGDRHVVMCHPGGADGTPLAATRAKEYAFLASDAFPAMLAKHGMRISGLAA
jgi:predicted glycoside hydrolase/deacetylase ChbG (UPF0249 family)